MTDTWKSGAEHAEAYFDECMELRAEIKRLRAEIEVLRQSRAQRRAEMKEECARVLQEHIMVGRTANEALAAIRALKERQ